MYLLSSLVIIPVVGGIGLLMVPFEKVYGRVKGEEKGKQLGLLVSIIVFLGSLVLWVKKEERGRNRFEFKEEWVWEGFGKSYEVQLGIDSISMFFVLLTTLLIPVCIVGSWEIKKHSKELISLLLVMEGIILMVFVVLDVIVFYIFFEAVLIPMYLIIGVWGSRERKVKAGYYLFIYTLFGSVLMLISILVMYLEVGSMDYEVLLIEGISSERQHLLWVGMFIGFAVKVPMVPMHIWLPEAHVEAPTVGSVILAGVLLKLGTYGMIRYLICLLPEGTEYYTPVVYVMTMVGIVYTSMTAIRQTDMKRVIAYASVAHMNMTLVGLFSGTEEGYEGAVLQMLSHGFVSGGLFICIGVLYERHHSRLIKYYSGVALTMPIFSMLFMILTMANIGLPGTSSFVGEFLILIGIFKVNEFVAVVSSTTMVLGGCYSLWLYNRVSYGNINIEMSRGSKELSRRELSMLVPLIILTIVMGVYPEVFLVEL